VEGTKHLRQSPQQCLPSTPKLTTFLSLCSIYVLESTSRPLASIRGSTVLFLLYFVILPFAFFSVFLLRDLRALRGYTIRFIFYFPLLPFAF